MRALHDRMMELFAKRERMLYFGVNQSIHLEIVRIARNEVLRAMHAQLHARMKRIRFRGNDIPHNWAAAVADHERIIAALEARDGPRLGALLQRHLDDSWDRLEASLAIDERAESLTGIATMSERIGFVGLGLMGAGFTRRLIATGHAVVGYDPDPARMREAEAIGVQTAASAAEVAQAADIILVCVINTAAVEDAATGPRGVTPRATSPARWWSTIRPPRSRRRCASRSNCSRRGAHVRRRAGLRRAGRGRDRHARHHGGRPATPRSRASRR